jgi:small subunit ribosomal protein S20|mmetsp:Transcript_26425/g.45132  ORF Transcript_26425/g.45132 Transcript_26425/m.45132 type:complete len:97 (+) Transcript_26425:38-328(+)
MANIKSAIKRIDITKRNTLKNKQYNSTVKTFIKKYLQSLGIYKKEPNEVNFQTAIKNLEIVYSKLDKATKVNVLHRNTAARKKSALKIALNSSKRH